MRKKPILLGIVGDSGAGKTTITKGIAKVLGEDRVAILCTDDYHKYNRTERTARKITPLHPDCNYLDIVEQHLLLIKAGQPILKPNYNHSTGDFDPPSYLQPKEFVIVEGLLGYYTKIMRDCYDVKLYLAPPDDLNIPWKMARDTQRRGYTEEAVLREMELRKPDAEAYIRPQRKWADMVISFCRPPDRRGETGARLDVSLVLRPTLPHPDLSDVLQGADAGLKLVMDRDMGLPADRLEINGNISDDKARQLEDLLWRHIPGEHQHLRNGDVGTIITNTGAKVKSYPLALTQLLIAYHLLKAASGHYN